MREDVHLGLQRDFIVFLQRMPNNGSNIFTATYLSIILIATRSPVFLFTALFTIAKEPLYIAESVSKSGINNSPSDLVF